jgi:hypothetical protein
MTQIEVVAALRLRAQAQRYAATNVAGGEVSEGAGGGNRGAEPDVAGGDEEGSEGDSERDGAPAPHHIARPLVGAGASRVTVKEEEEVETVGQLRDRLWLGPAAPAPGPRVVRVHIKVEEISSGEDTDGTGRKRSV